MENLAHQRFNVVPCQIYTCSPAVVELIDAFQKSVEVYILDLKEVKRVTDITEVASWDTVFHICQISSVSYYLLLLMLLLVLFKSLQGNVLIVLIVSAHVDKDGAAYSRKDLVQCEHLC